MHSSESSRIGKSPHLQPPNLQIHTKPEWLRIPEAVRIFGISRSCLYLLIANGEIKSTSLRKRGALRGIRLISYDSLVAFVENAATGGHK